MSGARTPVTEYIPVDLSAVAGAGADAFPPEVSVHGGMHEFQGLPFFISAEPDGHAPRLLAYGGAGAEGLREIVVSVDREADHVIVAHVLVESDIEAGGRLGELVADYRFTFSDGVVIDVPIRERFEIGTLQIDEPQLPHLPFAALPDSKPYLLPRIEGPWAMAGRRGSEVLAGQPNPFVLWAWANPRREVKISSLTVIPRSKRAVIGAITLGRGEEWPFVRSAPRTVKVELLGDGATADGVAVEVDRGIAGFPYPLPTLGDESEGLTGWGSPANATGNRSYVLVAAIPSATLTVRAGDDTIRTIRWGDLEAQGALDDRERLRLEIIDPGRNWVRTSVVDEEGRSLPCRISFRSAQGVPYQPHGHNNHLMGDLSTWHFDVGGDLRLGQRTYAYIDGACEGWLPRGDVIVEAACGFERQPLLSRVRIEPGQQRLTLTLSRARDMNAEGWYSGDTHVHFLSTGGGQLEARGEDLNVVNVLQAQWGHLFTNTEDWSGEPSVSKDGKTIVHVSQENRQHFMGHLSLLGLRRPVMPWSSDGPSEAELGGTLETMLSHWAEACHDQGGTVVIPHFPKPNGEHAALIATGRADAVEMIRHRAFNHTEYYRYLNAGYRLPLVGGTDKMTSEVPVGLYRTYVRIPSDEGLSHANWLRNLRLGRTFLSGGPLLRFSVEGEDIGGTVHLPAKGGTVDVAAEATSIFPLHRLEIIQEGRVVESTVELSGAKRLRIAAQLRVTGDTWLAVRAGGADYFAEPSRHFDTWRRAVFAHSSPVYVTCGEDWRMFDRGNVEYLLTLVEGARHYIRHVAAHDAPGSVTHHHGENDHITFLDRPLAEADAALRIRLASE